MFELDQYFGQFVLLNELSNIFSSIIELIVVIWFQTKIEANPFLVY